MTVVIAGADALTKALADLAKAGDLGARDGVVKGSRKLVGLTKAQLGGDERWARRGPGKTGASYDSLRRPVHVPRSGPAGSLTGHLSDNIHLLRPRKDTIGWSGKVSAMGGNTGVNLYAAKAEQHYPYLKPALVEFDRIAPALFEAAWAARIGKV